MQPKLEFSFLQEAKSLSEMIRPCFADFVYLIIRVFLHYTLYKLKLHVKWSFNLLKFYVSITFHRNRNDWVFSPRT